MARLFLCLVKVQAHPVHGLQRKVVWAHQVQVAVQELMEGAAVAVQCHYHLTVWRE